MAWLLKLVLRLVQTDMQRPTVKKLSTEWTEFSEFHSAHPVNSVRVPAPSREQFVLFFDAVREICCANVGLRWKNRLRPRDVSGRARLNARKAPAVADSVPTPRFSSCGGALSDFPE
jgi:hypothetical protein